MPSLLPWPPAAAAPEPPSSSSSGLRPEEAEAIARTIEIEQLGRAARLHERLLLRQRLRWDDLILARACALGHERAWEVFWTRFHPFLHARARSLTHDLARAAELADQLWAELFGLRERGGVRVSKLSSYAGTGSLEGWLSALLAQAHVQQWRRERRDVSLEACEVLHNTLAAPVPDGAPAPVWRQALEAGMARALEQAQPPVRLLLSLYYLDERTLAEIGVILGVHESTVSRRLDRALNLLRRQLRRELRAMGVPATAVQEAMATDPRWLHIDVRTALQAARPPLGRTPAEKAVQRG